MTTIEERVSRLEGGYEHLATKADLANLKAELNDKLNALEARLTRLFLGALIAGRRRGDLLAKHHLVRLTYRR